MPPKFNWREHAITAASLQEREFEPIPYIVDGLIPDGLTILAGPPKVGKSWLALDIAVAVTTGRACLGGHEVSQGDVLYCALEDNFRRLQRRIKLLAPDLEKWPRRLTLATSWLRLDQGGAHDIEDWANRAKAPRLVIIDTLAGVRTRNTTSNAYTDDYGSVEGLQHWANERGIAVIIIHHTRKMPAEDPIDRVSGTLGLTGGVDTIMVLDRSNKGKTLFVRGRDVEEAEHAVAFDKATYRWAILGDAAQVRRSDTRNDILAVLLKAPEPMGPTAIAKALHKNPNAVRQRLKLMCEAGEVVRRKYGLYVHADKYVAKAA